MRRLVQRALERRGFRIVTAESASEALTLIATETFDLVAVDNHMPGRSGRELLDDIVALEDHPPVVFVTGNDDTRVAVDALHAGALDFVVKTVGESFFDLLAGRFRQALSRADLERAKRRAEDELREANHQLEMLVREVHHRVANSLQMVLSFVSMQANQTQEPVAKEALAATQNRIRAIAKVHHRLYTRDDLTTIDLDEYLRTLAKELDETLSQDRSRIELRLSTVPVEVNPDEAVSIGVIINELVNNAAKYAFPAGTGGTIEISLEKLDDDTIKVCVADDGCGIEDGAPKGTGLGTRIIAAIARSLDTEVAPEPEAQGTRHCFVIKPRPFKDTAH